MQTFKVRVACDLYGSKHNAMFLFKPPPVALNEIVSEAQRFYQEEAESRKPAGHPGPAFQVVALQVYNPGLQQWQDVHSVSQLSDGCQLYAFQQQTPWHNDSYAALPDAMANSQDSVVQAQGGQQQQQPPPQTEFVPSDGTKEGDAFVVLDTKKDGVITLEEMIDAFGTLGLRFTTSQIQDLFTVADDDRDGVINRLDFEKFATRFPTVIDSVHQKQIDEHVSARGQTVLKDAESALAQEQEVERQLLEEAAGASKRVRELMGQIADHKMNQEVALQRKPVVEAQQQQLVEQELALAAQKERLRQAQEDIRRDIEEQLNQVSTAIGQSYQSTRSQPQNTASPQPQHYPQGTVDAETGLVAHQSVGASSNTSSFFLPSESPKGPRGILDAMGISDPHQQQASPAHGGWGDVQQGDSAQSSVMGLQMGAEVEACNFSHPEFNGLRGRIKSISADGKIGVELCIRGGLPLDMKPSNLRLVAPSNPPLGTEVEPTGPVLNTTTHETMDLRGQTGLVVGCRGNLMLCEFPPRPGIFEVQPGHLAARGGKGPVAPMQAAGHPAEMMSELDRAKREADVLRRELEKEKSKNRTPSPRHITMGAPAPDVSAALSRLGNLAEHTSPLTRTHISTLPTSPLKVYPPSAPVGTNPVYSAAHPLSMQSAAHLESLKPGSGVYSSLLPSTQEILRRVNVSMSPSAAAGTGAAAGVSPIAASAPAGGQAYSIGPIDPAQL